MVAHLKRGNNDERLRSIGIEAEQATHSRAILAATAEYQNSEAAAAAECQNSEAAQQSIRGGKCCKTRMQLAAVLCCAGNEVLYYAYFELFYS